MEVSPISISNEIFTFDADNLQSDLTKINRSLSSISSSLNILNRNASNAVQQLEAFHSAQKNIQQSKSSVEKVADLFSQIGSDAKASVEGVKSFSEEISNAVDSTGILGEAVAALSTPAAQLAIGVGTSLATMAIEFFTASENAERLTRKLEETNTVLEESRESFDTTRTSVMETDAANQNSLTSYQTLYDELMSLVDANGKVKSGYEERVDFINNELNSAFGTNLERIDQEVQGIQNLSQNWDNLMNKQRAGLKQDAYQEVLSNAQTQKQSLEQQMQELEPELQFLKHEIDRLEAEEQAAFEETGMTSYHNTDLGAYRERLQSVQQQYNNLKSQYDAYTQQEELYAQGSAQMVTGDYSGAISSFEQIDSVLLYTAEAGASLENLEQQATDAYNAYTSTARLTSWGATDAQKYADALAYAEEATAEYAEKTGQVIDGLVVGFDENGNAIIESVQEIRMGMNDEVDQGALELAGKINDAGIQVSDGFIVALSEKYPDIQEAAIQVLQALSVATEEQKPGLYEQLYLLGVEFDDNLKSGLKDNVQVVYQAGSDVITGFTDAAGNRITEVTPEFCQMLVDMGVVGKSQMDAYMQANNIQAPTMNPIATEEQAAAARQNVQSYLDSHPVTIKWGIGYENTTDEWYRQAASGGGSMYSYYHSRQYATGGLITQPHLGLVGEDGPEAIIPLSPSRRSRGLQLWQQAGKWLGVQLHAAGAIVSRMQPVSYPPILRNAEVQAQRMLLQSQLNTDAIRQACKEGCESAVLAVAVENRVQAVFNPKTAAKEMADYTDRELGRKVDLLKRYAK